MNKIDVKIGKIVPILKRWILNKFTYSDKVYKGFTLLTRVVLANKV